MKKNADDVNAVEAASRGREHQGSAERHVAMVEIKGGGETRTARLVEVLDAYAHDPDAFERMGELKVGETIAVDGGRTLLTRVR